MINQTAKNYYIQPNNELRNNYRDHYESELTIKNYRDTPYHAPKEKQKRSTELMKFSVITGKNIETHLKEEGVKKDETLTKNMNQNFPRENLVHTLHQEEKKMKPAKKKSFLFFLKHQKDTL